MGSYVGIDPDHVHELGWTLVASAGEMHELARQASSALSRADLESAAPVYLHALADDLATLGEILGRRADRAAAFAFALAPALAEVASTVSAVVPLPACTIGPQTKVGAASPCNPVVRVEVFRLAAGAQLPLGEVILKAQRDHSYRVEVLQNGRLRVTRIDGAGLGVGVGQGDTVAAETGGAAVIYERSAEVSTSAIARAADTYEIDAADLDRLIVADAIDEALTLGSGWAPVLRPYPLARSAGRRVASWLSSLPTPARSALQRVRDGLSWSRPAPVSTYIEGGATLNAGAAARDLLSKLGASVDFEAVAGIEDRATESVIYLRLEAATKAEIAFMIFGRSLRGSEELRVGIVRDRKGSITRFEATIVETFGSDVVRFDALVDLRAVDLPALADQLERNLVNPAQASAVIETLRAMGPVRVERSAFVQTGSRITRFEVAGNRVSFTVDTYMPRR